MSNIWKTLNHKKRGVMGIGTLIIFIAMILVAAVAAAVIISTSNVLQQRSLLVGQEARKSITNAIQVISIMAETNYTTETFNRWEILMQLSPGSDALQMRTFDLEYISGIFDSSADLLYEDPSETPVAFTHVNDTEALSIDLNSDGIIDYVYLNNSFTHGRLRFNISEVITTGYFVYEISEWINTSRDLSTTDEVVYLNLVPVITSAGIQGYFSAFLNTTGDDTLNGSMSYRLTTDLCDFARLPAEDKYCYIVMNGNDDYVLSSGERFKLLFQVDRTNEVSTGEDFGFIFISEKGRLTEARARTPDVIVETKAKLWPVG